MARSVRRAMRESPADSRERRRSRVFDNNLCVLCVLCGESLWSSYRCLLLGGPVAGVYPFHAGQGFVASVDDEGGQGSG
jgi:hypothetical protein